MRWFAILAIPVASYWLVAMLHLEPQSLCFGHVFTAVGRCP
jgi:hypothetical protein